MAAPKTLWAGLQTPLAGRQTITAGHQSPPVGPHTRRRRVEFSLSDCDCCGKVIGNSYGTHHDKVSIRKCGRHIKLMVGKKMTLVGRVQMHTISKQIELESPGYFDLKIFQFPSKPEQPGLSSSIRLDVVCI